MDARQVARAFGVHVSTIYRITDRFLQNNNVVDRPRSGRPSARTVISSELTCVIGSYQPPQQPGRQWEPTTGPFPTPRYDVV